MKHEKSLMGCYGVLASATCILIIYVLSFLTIDPNYSQPYTTIIFELMLCTYGSFTIIFRFIIICKNLFLQIIVTSFVSFINITFINLIFGLIYFQNNNIFHVFSTKEVDWLNLGDLSLVKLFDVSYKGGQPFFQNIPDNILNAETYGNSLLPIPYIQELYGFLYVLIILGYLISKLNNKEKP
jgi:hypothetical protein